MAQMELEYSSYSFFNDSSLYTSYTTPGDLGHPLEHGFPFSRCLSFPSLDPGVVDPGGPSQLRGYAYVTCAAAPPNQIRVERITGQGNIKCAGLTADAEYPRSNPAQAPGIKQGLPNARKVARNASYVSVRISSNVGKFRRQPFYCTLPLGPLGA